MCGIAGAFNFASGTGTLDVEVVSRLNALQARRGPDGEGLWSSADGRVAFGHRRLSVIDTGPQGAQPMSDATGRWTITFNGEIYNYRVLRHELERLGCVFTTNSDTEVLINAVAHWGEAGLRKLRGMYAFALWDAREQELWLARDPYGIKPLYVAESEGSFWIASQARALAEAAPVDTTRDAAALAGFYLWGHVPEPFTWWSGIRAFPPGHVQRLRKDSLPKPARAFARVEEAYIAAPARALERDELRQQLLDSVRDHLVSDVPVGVFLSAGVDSNVIAALASEQTSRLKTVTLAFDEYAGTKKDEAPLAEEAARILGSEHATVRIGRGEFETLVNDFFASMDQPTIDGLNTYLISHAAAKLGLKVVLSGLGGDELFGGYPSFREVPALARWGRRFSVLQPLGHSLQRALRTLPLGVPPKAAGLLSHASDLTKAYLLRRALYLEDELPLLLDESWVTAGLNRLATSSALARTLAPLRAADATERAQIAALESYWYMRNQLLRDTDWSSMAHGVEVRVPFVDFALLGSVGPAIASAKPPNKRDLAACWHRMPERVRSRRKTGFTTPVRQWIMEDGSGRAARGLRGWARRVHSELRSGPTVDARVRPIGLAA
jgi:asparagine synthase (glutamine-hydrolysing)